MEVFLADRMYELFRHYDDGTHSLPVRTSQGGMHSASRRGVLRLRNAIRSESRSFARDDKVWDGVLGGRGTRAESSHRH